MRIKNKQSLARLASISALSAGGLGLASTPLTPGVMNPLNGKVGFSPGYGTNYKISFAGTKLTVLRWPYGYSVFLQGNGARIKGSVAALGKIWNTSAHTVSSTASWAGLGRRYGGHVFGANANAYKLFRFQSGGKTLYGWLEYAVNVNATSGPDVQLIALAWDPSGNKLPAGQVPASSVPVAPAPVLAGIAALIWGAEGYRAWRAARNKAA